MPEVQMPDLRCVEEKLDSISKDLVLTALIGAFPKGSLGGYVRIFVASVVAAVNSYQKARKCLEYDPKLNQLPNFIGFVTNFETSVVFAHRAVLSLRKISGALKDKPALGKALRTSRKKVKYMAAKINKCRNRVVHIDDEIRKGVSGPTLPVPKDNGTRVIIGEYELLSDQYAKFLKTMASAAKLIMDDVKRSYVKKEIRAPFKNGGGR